MTHATFQIVYDGPALENHEMDVRELAPALLAFGDLLEQANRVLHGDRARVSVRVKGSFKTGSFAIELAFAQDFLNSVIDFFNSDSVNGALNLLEVVGLVTMAGTKARVNLIGLLLKLRGRRISTITENDAETVVVEVEGETIQVEKRVIELLRDYKVRKAIENVIAKPLDKEGVDTFAVVDATREKPEQVLVVGKEDRRFFVSPEPKDETIAEDEYRTNLIIVSPSFKEDNMWRFSDGHASFHAAMLDEDFLRRVQQAEELFGKNDIFEVKLRRRQYFSGETMKTDYEIVQVISHRNLGRQIELL